MAFPKISIVTCSYNQGAFIQKTIESVLAQNYPNMEHIVVDGMSTDATRQILAGYPHLTVLREPDRGQADAINKGFSRATGQIFGFLNSDDTLLPGALQQIAREIDPARGRHIVMGRCRFIDENDTFIGVEHPSYFVSHRRVLQIWKGYGIPQPATFWTREVWEKSGPLDVNEPLVLDYDLFCRFSRSFRFHCVDQVWANYRLHTQAKTSSMSDEERLRRSVAVSRLYWGKPWQWQYWQLRASYRWYQLDSKRRAASWVRQSREELRQCRFLRTASLLAMASLLAPDVVLNLLGPTLWAKLAAKWQIPSWLLALKRKIKPSPHTLAWRNFNGQHPDGWVGPTYLTLLQVESSHTHLLLEGLMTELQTGSPQELKIFLGTTQLARQVFLGKNTFKLQLPLPTLFPGPYDLKIVSSACFVPHNHYANLDYRPLAFKLKKLKLTDLIEFIEPYSDGWAGPRTRIPLTLEPHHTQLLLELGHAPFEVSSDAIIDLLIDNTPWRKIKLVGRSVFSESIALNSLPAGSHELKMLANYSHIPPGTEDSRLLSFRIKSLQII